MRPEFIVAVKEFKDHLRSKRFIAVFIILMILSAMSIIIGLDQYNNSLDSYKKAQVQAQASGAASPRMPSALLFFGAATNSSDMGGGFFSIVLMLLAMAMGFDLITREKEEGSLKSLLSHPVYRDAVINGKLIGGMSGLALVLGSAFLITLAIMLFYGVVPAADDLMRLAAYFILAMLYASIFFAISTLFSVVSRTSTASILCILTVMVALVIFPTFVPKISSAILGPAPEIPSVNGQVNTSTWYLSLDATAQQYYYNQWKLNDAMDTISPIYDFSSRITSALLYKQSSTANNIFAYSSASARPTVYAEPSLPDSLAYVWVNILAMVIEFAVFIALTYVAFMRMDVR